MKRLNQAKKFAKTQAKLQIDDVKLVIKTANDKANEFAEWARSLLFRQDNIAMQGAGGGIVKIDSGMDVVKGAGNSGVTKGTGEVSKSTSGNSKHLSDVKIPSVRNNEFNKWFDNLSAKEFEEMWNSLPLRSKIEDRIRRPGGYHEWHLVARTPKFKQWGISMDDIKEMRTLTKDVAICKSTWSSSKKRFDKST